MTHDLHRTTITDATEMHGYGPSGHGTWLVTCSCGLWQFVTTGGRNAAVTVEADHLRSTIDKPRQSAHH